MRFLVKAGQGDQTLKPRGVWGGVGLTSPILYEDGLHRSRTKPKGSKEAV